MKSVETPDTDGVGRAGASDTPKLAVRIQALLVEDNPINRLVASEYLKRAGCDVVLAVHGREAVDRCRENTYDIVFMDCQMPEMDGFEATRTIREAQSGAKPRTSIVALTASAMVEDRDLCTAAGMGDCVIKPVNQAMISDVSRRWVPSTHDALVEVQ